MASRSYDSTRKIYVVFGGNSGSNSVQLNGLVRWDRSVKRVLSIRRTRAGSQRRRAHHAFHDDLPGDKAA